jgi:hypothetical protein
MAPDDYWTKRLRSPAFKRALVDVVATELRSLAGERVERVLDAKLVRDLIAEWDVRLLNPEAVADIVIGSNRRVTKRLRRQGRSLRTLVDGRVLEEFDDLIAAFTELPPNAEDLITNLMEQEFIRRLFTDLIYSAIVNFNQRVNPLFGALAMRAIEDQIKGFIRLFMPVLQRQAIAFAIDAGNQRLVLDLTRAVIRRLLDEPLRNYLLPTTPAQRRKANAVVQRVVTDAKLRSLIREAAVAMWDDLYAVIRQKRVGDLLALEANAAWLAARCVDVIAPALARPAVQEWLASEVSLAAESTSATSRRRPGGA